METNNPVKPIAVTAQAVSDSADSVVSSADAIVQAVRFIKWLVIVLIVISLGGFIRSFQVQDSAEKAVDASKEAVSASNTAEGISEESRDAALSSLEELRAAIQQSQSNPAVANALQAIFRIEAALCGGPCPEVENP